MAKSTDKPKVKVSLNYWELACIEIALETLQLQDRVERVSMAAIIEKIRSAR